MKFLCKPVDPKVNLNFPQSESIVVDDIGYIVRRVTFWSPEQALTATIQQEKLYRLGKFKPNIPVEHRRKMV